MLTVARAESGDLASLHRFAAAIAQGSWFTVCGEAPTESERAEVAAYLAALGFHDTEITGVADWRASATLTQDPAWSRAWWEAESAARSALRREDERRWGLEPLLVALTAVTEAATALHDNAAVAMERAGLADPALTRVAAGAAAQACHQAALALAAGAAADHPFAIKYRLFAGGHWPLGIVGASFFVF
jgi:hypothetical protein